MSGKTHYAGGLVVALCLATARYGERCAAVGSVAGLPDRAPPSAVPVPPPPGGSIELGTPLERPVYTGFHVPWSRVLHVVAPDVGLDLAQLALDGLATSPATINFVNFGDVLCPTILDISADGAGWDALKDGEGMNCAPIIVLGLVGNEGRSLRHAGRDISISWFAGECLLIGARCTFVACPDEACVADTHASFRDIAQARLAPYLGEFVVRVVRQPTPPVSIAQPGAVDGQPVVVVASLRPAT